MEERKSESSAEESDRDGRCGPSQHLAAAARGTAWPACGRTQQGVGAGAGHGTWRAGTPAVKDSVPWHSPRCPCLVARAGLCTHSQPHRRPLQLPGLCCKPGGKALQRTWPLPGRVHAVRHSAVALGAVRA
eukprot:264824-Rhodomonas_salina.1